MADVKEQGTASVEAIYETYRRMAQAQEVEPQDVDDVVQEAIKAVLENQARAVALRKDEDAYRTGIIYKKIMDYHRQQKRRRRWGSLDDRADRAECTRYEPLAASPEDHFEKAQQERLLETIWSRLTAEEQRLWALLQKPEMSNETMAAELDLTMPALYKRIERLYQKVRDLKRRLERRASHAKGEKQ